MIIDTIYNTIRSQSSKVSSVSKVWLVWGLQSCEVLLADHTYLEFTQPVGQIETLEQVLRMTEDVGKWLLNGQPSSPWCQHVNYLLYRQQ